MVIRTYRTTPFLSVHAMARDRWLDTYQRYRHALIYAPTQRWHAEPKKKETKRKQLAQLAGRQNIKLELKMGNYANWFITWQLSMGGGRGKNNKNSEEGGKTGRRNINLKCQIVRILMDTKRVTTNCTRIASVGTVEPKRLQPSLSRLDLLRYIPRANAPWSDVASWAERDVSRSRNAPHWVPPAAAVPFQYPDSNASWS